MIDMTVVELSRWQFAATAMYHFLFVPLTIGLSVMMAIMESTYVMTGREIWRKMTLFWGTLFGINFAMGVATGIVMEFQFGMNWSYYSHYVGDVFGAPLAIEGLMAFFLEATFIGLFFFGWDRLSKVGHLAVTWLVAHRHQFLRAVDPGRQWLDAEPGRRQVQSRYHAHGSHRLRRRAVQSGGAGQVRPHRQRRLCDRARSSSSPSARCSCCRASISNWPSARWRSPPASACSARSRSSCWVTRAAMSPPNTRR